MNMFRITISLFAMRIATWSLKIFRVIGPLLAIFLAVLAAIWTYDHYISAQSSIDKPTARTHAIQQEQFHYGLNSISSLKVVIEEIYAANGAFPNSNQEAGLPPPEDYRSEILASVNISTGGIITVRYASFPGTADAWLRYTPTRTNDISPTIWKCETNIPDVPETVSTCTVTH